MFLEAELREQVAAGTRRSCTCLRWLGDYRRRRGACRGLVGVAPTRREADAPVAGTVFKIARGPSGEKIVYVRLFAGTCAAGRLHFGLRPRGAGDGDHRFAPCCAGRRCRAGEIAGLHGLRTARIGDRSARRRAWKMRGGFRRRHWRASCAGQPGGHSPARGAGAARGTGPADRAAPGRHGQSSPCAVWRRAEGSHRGDARGEYGIAATFGEPTPICVERPVGTGEAVRSEAENPFYATVGFRVEPRRKRGADSYVDYSNVPAVLYMRRDLHGAHRRDIRAARGTLAGK